MSNVVFYDGACGLCDHIVQWLLRVDKQERFLFAPLQGKTAAHLLKSLPENDREADTLILVENYGSDNPQIYLFGQGALRICWILGGPWRLVGWISFLPPCLYDWGYRIIARNRHRLFARSCVLPLPKFKSRFLP